MLEKTFFQLRIIQEQLRKQNELIKKNEYLNVPIQDISGAAITAQAIIEIEEHWKTRAPTYKDHLILVNFLLKNLSRIPWASSTACEQFLKALDLYPCMWNEREEMINSVDRKLSGKCPMPSVFSWKCLLT